jgi:TolB-like protein/tetratricopeptide (TPR) repeat protein
MFLPLFAELKRRRVFRALLGYGVLTFAVLQVAEPIIHGLHLPDWTLSLVVAALGIGFPVVIVLAWIFDMGGTGIERTKSVSGGMTLHGIRLVFVLVGIGLLAAAPGLSWYFLGRNRATLVRNGAGLTAPAPPTTLSIAVLPFADMSPQKDQEYFADGIAEEIMNALAQVESLRVSGRTSSFSFRAKGIDLAEVGRKLNVATVLEGSVRKAGNRVRISAQLVNASDGFHLWSRSFDRDQSDIFAVQEEIARNVVDALKLKLLTGSEPSTRPRRTANLDVYNHYLLGRHFLQGFSPDGARRALDAYQKAIALDSSYAPAWAGISEAIQVIESTDPPDPYPGNPERRERSLDAAERAIALAPDLADGYVARAIFREVFQYDWYGAQADLERALALSPGDPGANGGRAGLLKVLGRVPQAMAAARKTAELDPIEPGPWTMIGELYAAIDDFDQARAALSRALEISPDDGGARFLLCTILLVEGKANDALAFARRWPVGWARLTFEALASTNLKESEEALKTIIAKNWAYQVVQVHAWRGERDNAFEWLERSYAVRDTGLAGMKTDLLLRKLRDDARWKPFLGKMNLPVE